MYATHFFVSDLRTDEQFEFLCADSQRASVLSPPAHLDRFSK